MVVAAALLLLVGSAILYPIFQRNAKLAEEISVSEAAFIGNYFATTLNDIYLAGNAAEIEIYLPRDVGRNYTIKTYSEARTVTITMENERLVLPILTSAIDEVEIRNGGDVRISNDDAYVRIEPL